MDSNDELEDIILKKLQQYGDSVIGKDETSSKKVSKNSEVQSSNNVQTSTLHCDDKLSKKKRRKRKKKQVAMATENVDTKSSDKMELSGHERKLHEMSEQLGLNEFKHKLEEDAMEAKEAKEGERKSKKQKEPEVVVFKSYKSKKDKDKESDISDGQSLDQTSEFDMKKARADVRRFGIGGLTGGSKYKAMTTLLVELGAKPPKNKCVNYKKLQVKRKREMVAEIEKRRLDKKLGYKVPKLDDKSKRPKDRNDIGYIDGHIGKWKNGAVVISKKELKNINKKPRLK